MSKTPDVDFPVRTQRGDEDNPSHDSKVSQKQQPHGVRAPGASVPTGGVLVATRRGRGRRRGVRRTKAGVGRGRDGGRGHQSTAGRTDNDANDDKEDNDEKRPTDGGGDSEEDSAMSHYLACPFYKFEYTRHLGCDRKYESGRYSDVKRHILRCHSLNGDDALHYSMGEPHISDTTPLPHISEPERLRPREATALDELDVTGLSED